MEGAVSSAFSVPLFAGVLIFLFGQPAFAGPSDDCAAADGAYLSGQVVSQPRFARGHPKDGVELSHTILSLKADQDGKVYQVAMDNVFAAGYDDANSKKRVPGSTSAGRNTTIRPASIGFTRAVELLQRRRLRTVGSGNWVRTASQVKISRAVLNIVACGERRKRPARRPTLQEHRVEEAGAARAIVV
jgi:hypothetical protein